MTEKDTPDYDALERHTNAIAQIRRDLNLKKSTMINFDFAADKISSTVALLYIHIHVIRRHYILFRPTIRIPTTINLTAKTIIATEDCTVDTHTSRMQPATRQNNDDANNRAKQNTPYCAVQIEATKQHKTGNTI